MRDVKLRIILNLKVIFFISLSIFSEFVFAESYRFTFWPGLNYQLDSRFLSVAEGPCGDVLEATVDFMPKYSESTPFVPELVYELSSTSKVLQSWRVPVDALPIAIQGSLLYFTYDALIYSVTPKGHIQRQRLSQKGLPPEVVPCELSLAFEGSEYVKCWVFKDQHSSKRRILAFQDLCS